MIDGQHAISSHDGWPSLSADGPVTDVHIVVADDEIGHELPLSSKSTTDTLLSHGRD